MDLSRSSESRSLAMGNMGRVAATLAAPTSVRLHLTGRVEWVAHVRWLRALPQTIGFAHSGLPKPEGTVLGSAGIQLAIGAELHTVHGSKVSLKGFCKEEPFSLQYYRIFIYIFLTDFISCDKVKLVHLKVLAAADKDVLVRMQTGGRNVRRHFHLL